MDYGAAVSQKGYDVKTCADRFLVWSSAFQNMKVFNRYAVSTTVPAGADNVITITHNLGYYAPFLVLFNGPLLDAPGYGTNLSMFFSGDYSYITAYQYTDRLEISVPHYFDHLADGTTVYFSVYIFVNDLTSITEQIISTGTSSGATSTDYGIKASKDGYDVKTCTDDQLAFSSSFFNEIVDKVETLTLSAGSPTQYSNHSLAYVPAVWVYRKLSGDSFIQFSHFVRLRQAIALTDQHTRITIGSSAYAGDYYVFTFKDKVN